MPFNPSAIDGALEIARSEEVNPNDIDQVTVHTSRQPWKRRICLCPQDGPANGLRYSIPYAVAVALLRRKVILSDFDANKLGIRRS